MDPCAAAAGKMGSRSERTVAAAASSCSGHRESKPRSPSLAHRAELAAQVEQVDSEEMYLSVGRSTYAWWVGAVETAGLGQLACCLTEVLGETVATLQSSIIRTTAVAMGA